MENKEEIIERFKETIDEFYQKYKLPENVITKGEWNAFYDALSNHLKKEDFESALNIIIRRAFNLSLLNNSDKFTLYHLILALQDLQVFNVKTDEIELIKSEIMFNSLKNNVGVKSR